jgi:signal transduction histidine kinase
MDPTPSPDASYAALAQLALELGAAKDAKGVYQGLLRFVQRESPMSGMFVSSYNATTQTRTCVFAFGEGEVIDPDTFPPMPNTGSPHSRAVVTGETILTQDFQEQMAGKPRFNVGLERDPRLPQSSIVVPLKAGERILGGVEVQSTQPGAFTPAHVSTLQMAAQMAAQALEGAEALARERSMRMDLEMRAADLEAKVRDRVRELAAKNRELEAFSFTVAHDLRAPLRAILTLSADLLGRLEDARPDLRGDVEVILSSSEQMARLVEDLLEFARTAQGNVKREMVDLGALARASLADLEARDPGRKTDLRVGDNLFVEADGALVRILLDNLLGNAWKYSAKKPVTGIRVGARLQGGEVVYFLEDQGVGFDPAQSARLFSAFQRLHPANEYEGTGIGLATAQRIVQRHGGRIWAESVQGEGATFSFTLAPPARRTQPEPAP